MKTMHDGRMRLAVWAVAAAVALGTAGAARAADFYVDLEWTGTEAGTQTQPYRTISNAVVVTKSTAGTHNIYIATGTYKDVANGGLEDYDSIRGGNGTESHPGGGYPIGNTSSWGANSIVNIYGGYAGWDGDGTAPSDFDWTAGSRVPRSTIIDLQGANSRAFFNNSYFSAGGVYDGLTIQNGNITGDTTDGYGGGAMLSCHPNYQGNGQSLLINDCLFTNNASTASGGAVRYWAGAAGWIRNSTFIDNTTSKSGWEGGGAVSADPATGMMVSNCVFRGNRATAGSTMGECGALRFMYSGTVISCLFENNTATRHGGALFTREGLLTVRECTFRGNSAPKGAAIGGDDAGGWRQGAYDLRNCLIVSNTGGYAVQVESSWVPAGAAYTLDMLHCTVADNPNGGVRARDQATGGAKTMRIRNSIVANNGAYGIYQADATDTASILANNDVYNNTSGNYYQCTPDANSISSDPSFAGGGDYRLAKGSPCVDTAANLAIATDLNGVGRPTRFGYDMGCYEEWQLPIIANRAPVVDSTSVTARAFFTYESTGIVTTAWFVLDTTDKGTNSLSGWWQYADSGAQTQGVIFGQAFTGLTPSTTYRYRCVSSNSYDLFWGPVATFATPPAGGATRLWTGASTNALASNTNNWQDGLAPGSSDYVLLDASSSNMTWDAGVGGLPDTVARWTQTENYTGTVTVSTLSGSSGFTNFTVSGDMTIAGGMLTHGDNSTYGSGNTEMYRLSLAVGGDLLVSSGGRIDGDARGYAVSQGPGAGVSYHVAASHGGQGGKYAGNADASYAFRNTYGSIRTPIRLGSGGGEAGSGGGAIRLTVGGATTVDGMILACGGRYRTGGNVKGGSGGSIWLRTGTLGGSGIIEASAGSPNRSADSTAGGGRVAVVVTNGGSVGSVACLAYGGAGTVDDVSHRGAAGTVYIETTNQPAGGGRLIVDNNNVANGPWTGASTLPAEAEDLGSFAKVIVTNAGILAIGTNTTANFGSVAIEGGGEVRVKSTNLVTFPGTFVLTNLYRLSLDVPVTASGNWTIANGGVLTHAPVHFANVVGSGTVDPPIKLYLSLNGNLIVQPGGRIDVDGKGNGYTRGKGWQSGATPAGAAYGGCGGVNTPPQTPRTTYGSIREPYFHGSCGDYGAGGGVVRLVVSGATTIDGTVSANASDGGRPAATNGTGGSVWIQTGTLGGTGAVAAIGGSINNWFPCGGGGRIAVTVTNGVATGGVLFQAFGGKAWTLGSTYTHLNAAAGTVYLETQGATPGKGQLFIDNNNVSCNYNGVSIAKTEIESSANNTPTLVMPALVTITNRAQVKLNGNLNAEAFAIYSNSYLDLAGYTGTVRTLTITNRAFAAGTYAVADLGPLVTDSSAGQSGRLVVLGRHSGAVIMIR